MNKTITSRVRGVTLVELLVAVAITAGMLLATSMIFKIATDASGKALATTDIMSQLRTLTRQLKQDFTHLRPDMPMAIIFEEGAIDTDGDGNPDIFPRQDRIVFFANGNYEVTEGIGTDVANIARILYSQTSDILEIPGDRELYFNSPSRRILGRGYKILVPTQTTFDPSVVSNKLNDPENKRGFYHAFPIDDSILFGTFGAVAYWKNLSFAGYGNEYFNDTEVFSMVRRPDMNSIINAWGDSGVQRNYMLSDTTDFKVEVWFDGAARWFPNDTDVLAINLSPLAFVSTNSFAFFWNAPETDTPSDYIDSAIKNYPIGSYEWRGSAGLELIKTVFGWNSIWPKALRFTFTLYDKNRRHFPEGQTFSYVVKLPAR